MNMVKVELILCTSYGDSNGEWDTVVTSIPEVMRDRGNHDEVAEYILENTDLIGEDVVFCGVFNWRADEDE